MRKNNPASAKDLGYLPVPPVLRDVAAQIESARIPVNRERLDAALRAGAADKTSPCYSREARLLHQRATDLGRDVHYSGEIAVSPTSYALVEISGLRYGLAKIVEFLDLPAGHTLVGIDVPTMPFRALARLSGDATLGEAATSDDAYAWIAARTGLTRTTAKRGLFAQLIGQSAADAADSAAIAGEQVDADIVARIAQITALFPDAFGYVAHLAAYGPPQRALHTAQALTNRVAHLALGAAHQRLADVGVTAPAVALYGSEATVYLVPDHEADRFVATVDGLTVDAEGITLPADTFTAR